jgi:crossover junction endodeoxyribonuclease RusA
MSWQLCAVLSVSGIPKPQPRPKATIRGRHAGVYTPRTAQGWKEIIIQRATEVSLAGGQIEGVIALKIAFVLPRPKAHKKETYVTTKPDIDNLLKSTMDALTDCAVWRDDSQLAEVHMSKVYQSELVGPGAVIEIYKGTKKEV